MVITKRHNLLKYFSIAAIVVIAFLLLWKFFVYTEPPFIVIGDKNVLSKLHVNVNIGRANGKSSWKTIFLNGKYYSVNNQGAGGFTVYANYDNELFFDYNYENKARMLGNRSIATNTFLFCRINSDVYFSVIRSSGHLAKCDNMDKRGSVKLLSFDDLIKYRASQAKKNGFVENGFDEKSYYINLRKSFFYIN